MKKINIILVGGGGHARACSDVIDSSKIHYKIIGYVDLQENKQMSNLNYLGNDKQQGGNIITFRASSVFGSDTIFDFLSFMVNTKSDTSWGCIVPPKIKDVFISNLPFFLFNNFPIIPLNFAFILFVFDYGTNLQPLFSSATI